MKKAFISICALAEERTGQAVPGGTTLFVVRGATQSGIDFRYSNYENLTQDFNKMCSHF